MWGRVADWVHRFGGQRSLERWVGQLGQPRGILGQFVGNVLVESNTQLTRDTVALLELRDGQRVLDIGSGPGQGIAAAMDAARVTVDAVDPSTAMMRRLRVRWPRAIRQGRLHIHNCTLDDLAVTVPMDAAFGVNVVYFLPDRISSLTHLAGMVAPGGRVALGYRDRRDLPEGDFARLFGERHNLVTSDELEAEMIAAGFSDVVTVRSPDDSGSTGDSSGGCITLGVRVAAGSAATPKARIAETTDPVEVITADGDLTPR